ncbi:MAG: glycosyltransferase family 2 protein [Candidatus Caldarchaeales archaeon]
MPTVSVVIPFHRKYYLSRLIESILNNDFPENNIEIILIDNSLTNEIYNEIVDKFKDKNIIIIRKSKPMLVSESRNIGIISSRGKYILLIDDDNIISRNMIKNLVSVMESDPSIGVTAPAMYYLKNPNRIWCISVRRNMYTSITRFITEVGKKVSNDQLIPSDDFPNCFMIRRSVLEEVGLFDQDDFPMHYEEADLCARIRRNGYKIVCVLTAKVWHDVPLNQVRYFANWFRSPLSPRSYYSSRNRIIFHRRYSTLAQFVIFISIFNWVVSLYYIFIIFLFTKMGITDKLKVVKNYLNGILDGIISRKRKWMVE